MISLCIFIRNDFLLLTMIPGYGNQVNTNPMQMQGNVGIEMNANVNMPGIQTNIPGYQANAVIPNMQANIGVP